MSVLDRIIRTTTADLGARMVRIPAAELEARALMAPRRPSFAAALCAPGLSVIAEHKRRSPSRGAIRVDLELTEIVRDYERGGAAAVSVLTEERHFGGALDDLTEAAWVCGLPLLRKDFVVDRYQLLEARAAGASAVLLIVAALPIRRLEELHGAALDLGLDVLVEVHDAVELDVARSIGARIVGVNNRDLRDFSIDVERTYRLLDGMPAGALVVAESGIRGVDDARRLAAAGVDAVLVGEALMAAPDPRLACEELACACG
ncbi:Indole-3-glycerol phosphate synthase [Patulibacter medicamentivorans]|uniref:Indole-3-glycerol phosphate synthase n=1 Tax=Patulibacter medicamentivorans TaxID=1097667 RepID=H0EAH8_9ACTN|nr:indole-3-glycerol phosphate synthase TrpC [Patulibacter medicamentivorans]EHN09305.1 Indole-3-glycerol phosphate synthase [Patulibacter medicamentivorans]